MALAPHAAPPLYPYPGLPFYPPFPGVSLLRQYGAIASALGSVTSENYHSYIGTR